MSKLIRIPLLLPIYIIIIYSIIKHKLFTPCYPIRRVEILVHSTYFIYRCGSSRDPERDCRDIERIGEQKSEVMIQNGNKI